MRIVQVPMEEREARELALLAKKMRISRADLIRRACASYLRSLREAALERDYERGYREQPEEVALASASAILAGSLLGSEDWGRFETG